ncbi:hypothetical protein MXB_5581 [Myxobolus squamalis]|nr:hypothetical protein MXB_5581 [Myxobolus squamalis]
MQQYGDHHQVLLFKPFLDIRLYVGDNDSSRPSPKPSGCNATLMYHYVSFPNYFYELMMWTIFTFLTKSFASAAFTIVGGAIMSKWALSKHRGYIKDPTYPKNRKAIIPMIL